MARFSLRDLSERQQVVGIILLSVLAVVLLWFYLLYPQHKKRRALESEIDSMRGRLARSNYLLGEEALRLKRDQVQEQNLRLHAEWNELIDRMSAFANREDLVATEVPRVDYKMAIYEARQRLRLKAADANISLPPELGMLDLVHSDEDARTLMIQLRAVETLVDLMLDLRINMLRKIEPLRPILYTVPGKGSEVYVEEYPVHVEFYGSLRNLYDLFYSMMESGHVFGLKNILVKAASANDVDLLSIEAEMSTLLFVRDPDALSPPVERKVTFVAPAGH